MTVKNISSKAEFDALLKDFDGVILADFYATWCGPCKMLAPVLDEVAGEVDASKVQVVKIDIDEVQDLTAEYGITSVPTVFVGANHEIKEGFLGAYPKEFYLEKIAQFSAGEAA